MSSNSEDPALRFADTITREMSKLAVLFVDISGSTRLYSTLGDNAAQVVVNACVTMLTSVATRFHGRVVKTIGDEVMCVFRRADDAAAAACEMQETIDAKRPGNQHVQIHIGMHYGPVLLEDNDVFGDTVNTAAYLRSVAIAGQILVGDSTYQNFSPELKNCARAVFTTAIKSASETSTTVYQLLWHRDSGDRTYGNLRPPEIKPGSEGSLILSYRDIEVRMGEARPEIAIGRGEDCDIAVDEMHASRKHASVKLVRNNFYLVDHSLNGTFVTLEGGEEIHLRRQELMIERSGSFALGRAAGEGKPQLVVFTRDRRAYRAG
jgi:class 3 adenylate cyclase